jgi:hypothetical protein
LKRPTQNSGQSIGLIGHHEIMIPLLAAALKGALGVPIERIGGPDAK